jgi:hypothetical protein
MERRLCVLWKMLGSCEEYIEGCRSRSCV